MRILLSSVPPELSSPEDIRIFELYHENSKLHSKLLKKGAFEGPGSPAELHAASRGFRQFPQARRIALPDAPPCSAAVSDVLGRRRSSRTIGAALDFGHLSSVLQVALGPTALVEDRTSSVTQMLRAWPSAGGLYPIDTYVVARLVVGLNEGIYHYNVPLATLEELPSTSVARVLTEGFFGQEWAAAAAVAIFFVATFERTVTKYGERGYRLVLLDAGHACQNVLIAAEQAGLQSVAFGGFCEDVIDGALGVDGVDETVIHCALLGGPTNE